MMSLTLRIARYSLLAAVVLSLHASHSNGQRLCGNASKALTAANRFYSNGYFDETISTLRPCWELLERDRKSEALRLMSISYFALDMPDTSSILVRRLVRDVDTGYRADRQEDPLFFQDLVQRHRPKWYENKWLWAGGGLAVTGTILYLILRPQGPQQLPAPPGPPG